MRFRTPYSTDANYQAIENALRLSYHEGYGIQTIDGTLYSFFDYSDEKTIRTEAHILTGEKAIKIEAEKTRTGGLDYTNHTAHIMNLIKEI